MEDIYTTITKNLLLMALVFTPNYLTSFSAAIEKETDLGLI